MAKEKKEKVLTAANKAVLDARQKLETANKADEAKSTDATKAAVNTAKSTLAAAVAVENRERFVRVAGGRVKKARIAIKNLANVAAPRSYTYTEADVALAEKALMDAVASSIAALRGALVKGASTTKAADDFSF